MKYLPNCYQKHPKRTEEPDPHNKAKQQHNGALNAIFDRFYLGNTAK